MKKIATANISKLFEYIGRKRYIAQVLLDPKKVTIKNKIEEFSKKSNHHLPEHQAPNSVKDEVAFVVKVQFSAINTFVQVMDCKGLLEFQSSAGQFYSGKQKKDRLVALQRLFDQMVSKFPDIKNKYVALHLYNVNARFWVVRRLKKKLFLKSVVLFRGYPHNGCRKKKLKRKKFKKKLFLRRNGRAVYGGRL